MQQCLIWAFQFWNARHGYHLQPATLGRLTGRSVERGSNDIEWKSWKRRLVQTVALSTPPGVERRRAGLAGGTADIPFSGRQSHRPHRRSMARGRG